jgi:hypothetical protein
VYVDAVYEEYHQDEYSEYEDFSIYINCSNCVYVNNDYIILQQRYDSISKEYTLITTIQFLDQKVKK